MKQRKLLGPIDGTPEKRLFLSIISDYDLKTGLCELVDNAVDNWIENGKLSNLKIEITLDAGRQLICVKDNAGGVREDQLRLLVAPGASRNDPQQELIGIFGVGGKRAGVALGELVEIRTRHKNNKSLQIDIDSNWLAADDWHLNSYEISHIEENSTIVDISKIRQPFTDKDIQSIREHLGQTYRWFIDEGCQIVLNKIDVKAISFDNWAFPPGYNPKSANFSIEPVDDRKIDVSIEAGLILDRDVVNENYGVYIYCNNRLIVKELRTRDVGYFVTGEAGVPHPDASLCRAIVHMQGSPDLMPWTSNKSGINFDHAAYALIRTNLISLVSYFSSLSRRLKNDWEHEVFPYHEGTLDPIDPEKIIPDRKLVLPELPRTRSLGYLDNLKVANRKVLDNKPWTLGLVEAMGIVDLVTRQKIETRNRTALILLDSNFEIGLKEFIAHSPKFFPPYTYNDAKLAQLFSRRTEVIKEVQAKVAGLSPALIAKVNHYYSMRNKLIHERATANPRDEEINDYRALIEKVLRLLFKLKFPSE